ncbi:MAG TPA: hypothetical protein VMB83_07955 [Roseiarcus sp.]|nr:hypothetical protein [Roseiarcus sp.]
MALTVIRQAELEAARQRGRVAGGDIERGGWAAKPQWKRSMRVEAARIIDRIARGADEPRCDLVGLRRRLDERAREAASIAARPCGFDHANGKAREIAAKALRRVMKQIVRDPLRVAHHLFGPPRDPEPNETPIPGPLSQGRTRAHPYVPLTGKSGQRDWRCDDPDLLQLIELCRQRAADQECVTDAEIRRLALEPLSNSSD